jgi:hypothetical protein
VFLVSIFCADVIFWEIIGVEIKIRKTSAVKICFFFIVAPYIFYMLFYILLEYIIFLAQILTLIDI